MPNSLNVGKFGNPLLPFLSLVYNTISVLLIWIISITLLMCRLPFSHLQNIRNGENIFGVNIEVSSPNVIVVIFYGMVVHDFDNMLVSLLDSQ